MAVDFKKLKAGDKVRYLGGDVLDDDGELTVGKEYNITRINEDADAFFVADDGWGWYVSRYDADCFELVADEADCNCDTIEVETKDGVFSETTCNCDCKHVSHIASLAKEIAKLKRELTEYKEYIEKEVVLLDERITEVESKKPSGSKAQYITVYGAEYIDKLFGGDGE